MTSQHTDQGSIPDPVPFRRADLSPRAGPARRAVQLVAAAALVAGVAGIGASAGGHPARADTPGFYNLTSAANTVSLEVDVANVPLLAPQLLFFSPGTAQAQLDSYGDSTAYAGAPFVGQTVEGVGGLVSGLGSGVLPPLPQTLPGYIQSSNPSAPTVDDSQGPYSLEANSAANSSTATAGIAAVSGQPTFISSTSTATTTLDPATGALTSTATSITQPLAVGDLVKLGTIQATATMNIDSNGHLSRTSSLDLGTITIAGLKIGLTQSGLQILGHTLLPPSLSALDALLSTAGISLKLLPATQTSTSVTSEGLQITLTKKIPVEGATALIITIGQANAQLQYGLVTTTPATVPNYTAPPPTDTGTGTSSQPVATTPVQPTTTPAVASPVLATNPTNTEPGSASGPRTTQPNLADIANRLGPDAIRWYLILAAAGIALTATSRTAARLGIRRTSSSAKGTR